MHTELIALLGVLSFLTDTVLAETCSSYKSCPSGYHCCDYNTDCCKDDNTDGGTIAGIVIGFIFVGVVVFIVVCCCKKHHTHTIVQPASAPVVVQQQVSNNYAAPQPGYGPHYGNMPPPQNMGMYPPPPHYPPPHY